MKKWFLVFSYTDPKGTGLICSPPETAKFPLTATNTAEALEEGKALLDRQKKEASALRRMQDIRDAKIVCEIPLE